jgi:molybdopterin molybdotransferase
MPGLKPGFGRLATLGEVFDILYSNLPALGQESVPVADAFHRVAAKDVIASIDVPHFVKAAMDGYAVRASDTFGATDSAPSRLEVAGSVWPGQVPESPVVAGVCFEIGTGAPLPEGADAVVMVEYTELSDSSGSSQAPGRVSVRKGVAPRENVVEVGSDVRAGAVVIAAGTLIEPRHLGVLAACGLSGIEIVKRPRVALFSTGPELVPAGGRLAPGSIYDINTYTLRAALQADGCEVVDLGIVPDDQAALDAALSKALEEGDFTLLSGGSSLGGGDLVGDAFTRAGKMLIHGAAVKPGKPVVIGIAETAAGSETVPKIMIGLPGYPMSALSDYYIFVQPFIRRALGTQVRPTFVEAVLARKHPSTVGRYEFVPVRLVGDRAVPLTKGSSSISALADADGFVEIDENIEVLSEGEQVRVRLF